jgi:hypothetical protein
MSNFNNDGYIAGDQRYNVGIVAGLNDDEHMGIAHEIDLADEAESVAEQQGKGAIKRKR